MDIVITLPKSVKWEVYQKEIDKTIDGSEVMNFKVGKFPTKLKTGDRCYICYNGNIIGWMKVVGMESKEFTCSTNGKEWVGNFIQRSGGFNKIKNIKCKGFQGFRYFDNL